MAERAIHRKSQLIFHSVLPVKDTHEELIKKKLETGKFPFTITGVIKILGILVLLASIALYLAKSWCGGNTPEWYEYLFPVSVGVNIIVAFSLYFTFSAGFTVNRPGVWVKIDILANLALSILTIVSSIIDSSKCKATGSIHSIPSILGMCGGGILIASCAALFLLYRYKEDEEVQLPPPPRIDPRKSLHV